VVGTGGQVRSIELFTETTDSDGAKVLRHAAESDQYDAKPIHILHDYGDEQRLVQSEPIERDTLRIEKPLRKTLPLRSDYFIIEEE
jgi:hypothetical protein